MLRDPVDPFSLTYAEISDILNAKGIRILRSQEWTASRTRIPVTKAQDLLKEEEERAFQSLPTYGIT